MSGIGAIAHGNDIGGSLRFPAAATGAATVKPGLGRVPAYNPSAGAERGLLAQIMSVQGAIAREVKDVRRAMRALIQYDPHDPWMVPMPFEGPPRMVRSGLHLQRTRLNSICTRRSRRRSTLLVTRWQMQVTRLRRSSRRNCVRRRGRQTVACLVRCRRWSVTTFANMAAPPSTAFSTAISNISNRNEGQELLLGLARRSHYVREWNLFLQQYPWC